MAITAGFGTMMDLERGTMRQWVMTSDGVKRWAYDGKPCEPNCDRSACGDHSPSKCDNPDCPALMPNEAKSNLNDLLCCEGELRDRFEKFIASLTAVSYSLERNEHGEYRNPAVYHMWTGFCIAQAT